MADDDVLEIKIEPEENVVVFDDISSVENMSGEDQDMSIIDLTEDDIDMKSETDIKEEKKDDESVSVSVSEQNGNHSGGHISFSYAPIPPDYPKDQIVIVSNLSPIINRYYLLKTFSKYGTIAHIQKTYHYAQIAFSAPEEARKATYANNLLKICGQTVGVRLRGLFKRYRDYPSDQVAFIFDLLPHTPDEEIRKHFESCGNLIGIPYYRCSNGISRVLIFEKPGAADIAFGLNGTLIRNTKIRVKPRGARAENYKEGQTVVMFNLNGFTEIAKSTITDLFSKCGKIKECDILCNAKKLAVIVFKNHSGMENAMKMSGSTVGTIRILLDRYTEAKYKRTKVSVYNLAPGINVKKIHDAFSKVAVIDKIHHLKHRTFALIEFATTDDYCNAFRVDAENVGGRDLVLKPFQDKDESLEYIIYGREDWVVIWGDRVKNRIN